MSKPFSEKRHHNASNFLLDPFASFQNSAVGHQNVALPNLYHSNQQQHGRHEEGLYLLDLLHFYFLSIVSNKENEPTNEKLGGVDDDNI